MDKENIKKEIIPIFSIWNWQLFWFEMQFALYSPLYDEKNEAIIIVMKGSMTSKYKYATMLK